MGGGQILLVGESGGLVLPASLVELRDETRFLAAKAAVVGELPGQAAAAGADLCGPPTELVLLGGGGFLEALKLDLALGEFFGAAVDVGVLAAKLIAEGIEIFFFLSQAL